MTPRNVQHATFTIERIYAAPRERIFKAFSDIDAKARWFVGPDKWQRLDNKMDFRVGGTESLSGGLPGGPVHHYNSTFLDIVPDERIISVYEMHIDRTKISVSLATVEFKPAGTGTRLVITEQGAFLDGYNDAESRERGTQVLLDQLGAALR